MPLSGRTILARNIITKLIDPTTQSQPCGVDLTLKSLSIFSGPGTLDFPNTLRQTAETTKLPAPKEEQAVGRPRYWFLSQGSYVVEFNELLKTPMDCVAFVYPRSSLWRSGATVITGVCDAGYEGALGGMLQVTNPHGIKLYEDARIAQIVFHEMIEGAGEGYKGVYQGAVGI